jgi:hypothetical protein
LTGGPGGVDGVGANGQVALSASIRAACCHWLPASVVGGFVGGVAVAAESGAARSLTGQALSITLIHRQPNEPRYGR